jgi:hypothetical protein
LHQTAQKDMRIYPNYFFRLNLCVAPASMAASISSRDTGLAGLGMIPFNRNVGIFGRMITPSWWKKNLNQILGLRYKRSRTALSFTAGSGFHKGETLHTLYFNESKESSACSSNWARSCCWENDLKRGRG